MSKLGKFLHECPSWDFLEIDISTDAEAVGCSCFRGNLEADVYYERAAKELDEHNASSGSETRAAHVLQERNR